MAYYYSGDGFQLQQQTGGYNIANQVYANMPQNNPFKHAKDTSTNLDALVEEARLDDANRYLLETANPYDGKTAAQKLREVGLDNWYTRKNLDKLNTNYASETKNMKDVRQSASDFRTEALQTEALRLKAQGDPKAISEYNDYVAQTLQAMVANGSVTPKTAETIYSNLSVNAAQQDRATIANTYAQARDSNANAHMNELKAKDYIQEQNDLNNFSRIVNAGAAFNMNISDLNSAIRVGRTIGLTDAQIISAFNSNKITRYAPQYGDVYTQLGSIKLNQGGGTSYTPMSSVVENNTPGNIPTSPNGVGNTNLELNTASASALQSPSSLSAAGTAYSNNNATATNNVVNNNNNTTTQTIVPTSENTYTPSSASALNTNTAANAQQQVVEQNAQRFNESATQTALQNNGAIIQTNSDGRQFITLDTNNASYNPNTGVWSFSENIPDNRTDYFIQTQMHDAMVALDRQTNGTLRDILKLSVDGNGNMNLVPDSAVQEYLQKHPEAIPAVNNIINRAMDIVKPGLQSKNDLKATVAYLEATFGASEELRKSGENKRVQYLAASQNTKVYENEERVINEQYNNAGNIENLRNISAALTNDARLGNNQNFLNNLVNSNLVQQGTQLTNVTTDINKSIRSFENDYSSLESDLNNINSIREASKIFSESGNSPVTAYSKLIKTDQGLAANLDGLEKMGVITRASTSKDGSQDPENTEDSIELVSKTSGEFFTTFDRAATALQSKFPKLKRSDAQAVIYMAGVTGQKSITNHIFPAITDTNSPFVINMDAAVKLASSFESIEYDPNGKQIYNDIQQLLANSKAASDNLKTATESANTSFTNLTSNLNNLGKYGLKNNSIVDTNHVKHANIVASTVAGKNELENGGEFVGKVINDTELYYDSVNQLDAARQTFNNYASEVSKRVASTNRIRALETQLANNNSALWPKPKGFAKPSAPSPYSLHYRPHYSPPVENDVSQIPGILSKFSTPTQSTASNLINGTNAATSTAFGTSTINNSSGIANSRTNTTNNTSGVTEELTPESLIESNNTPIGNNPILDSRSVISDTPSDPLFNRKRPLVDNKLDPYPPYEGDPDAHIGYTPSSFTDPSQFRANTFIRDYKLHDATWDSVARHLDDIDNLSFEEKAYLYPYSLEFGRGDDYLDVIFESPENLNAFKVAAKAYSERVKETAKNLTPSDLSKLDSLPEVIAYQALGGHYSDDMDLQKFLDFRTNYDEETYNKLKEGNTNKKTVRPSKNDPAYDIKTASNNALVKDKTIERYAEDMKLPKHIAAQYYDKINNLTYEQRKFLEFETKNLNPIGGFRIFEEFMNNPEKLKKLEQKYMGLGPEVVELGLQLNIDPFYVAEYIDEINALPPEDREILYSSLYEQAENLHQAFGSDPMARARHRSFVNRYIRPKIKNTQQTATDLLNGKTIPAYNKKGDPIQQTDTSLLNGKNIPAYNTATNLINGTVNTNTNNNTAKPANTKTSVNSNNNNARTTANNGKLTTSNLNNNAPYYSVEEFDKLINEGYFDYNAGSNNSKAMSSLAEAYTNGYGPEPNATRAIQWLEHGIENGNYEAVKTLINLYRYGNKRLGIKPDLKKAKQIASQYKTRLEKEVLEEERKIKNK